MLFALSIVTLVGGMGLLGFGLVRGINDPLGMMFQAMGVVLFWVMLLGLAAAGEIRRLERKLDAATRQPDESRSPTKNG
ncbi:MAG: hypothetical protein ACLFV7_09125 [Phycisphaerae bacterium]